MGVMLQEEKKEEKEEMAKATKRRYLPATELLASLGGMAMIVMIGTRAYMYFDEHSFVPALYFTVRIASARASARATGSVAEVRGSARAGRRTASAAAPSAVGTQRRGTPPRGPAALPPRPPSRSPLPLLRTRWASEGNRAPPSRRASRPRRSESTSTRAPR